MIFSPAGRNVRRRHKDQSGLIVLAAMAGTPKTKEESDAFIAACNQWSEEANERSRIATEGMKRDSEIRFGICIVAVAVLVAALLIGWLS